MHDEARRWCDEALSVARSVGAKEDETHALNTLATLEMRHDNIEEARALLLEARSRAEEIGARFQELRAQFSLGALALDQGDLPTAKEALDDAIARAESYGLIWGQYGINSNVLRLFTYYAIGAWDEGQAIAAAIDQRILGASYLSAAVLYIEVARGSDGVDDRIEQLAKPGKDLDWVRYMRSGCGADRALYKGDLDTAEAMIEAILDELVDAEEGWELSAIWPGTLGITIQAERAELARRAGDAELVADAIATGKEHLERCRKAIEYSRSLGRQIGPEALAWVARAEAESSPTRGAVRRSSCGAPRPKRSRTATSTRRHAPASGSPKLSSGRASATRPRTSCGALTRPRSTWGPSP